MYQQTVTQQIHVTSIMHNALSQKWRRRMYYNLKMYKSSRFSLALFGSDRAAYSAHQISSLAFKGKKKKGKKGREKEG